jgi:transposase
MADLAYGRMRGKLADLEKALTGLVRPHHRFLLTQQLAHIDFLDEQLIKLNEQIEQHLETLAAVAPSASEVPIEPSDVDPQPEPPLSAPQAVVLLDTIPGVSQTTAEIIVAELGLDMSRFPSAKQAAAWAGVAPGNYNSAGKQYSGKTRAGNSVLRSALSQAAWAAARSKNTYLAALYKRLAGRRGSKRAIVAVAHSILVSAYYMLSRRQPYQELGSNYFDEHKQQALLNRLTHRLEKLGYEVQIELATAA